MWAVFTGVIDGQESKPPLICLVKAWRWRDAEGAVLCEGESSMSDVFISLDEGGQGVRDKCTSDGSCSTRRTSKNLGNHTDSAKSHKRVRNADMEQRETSQTTHHIHVYSRRPEEWRRKPAK